MADLKENMDNKKIAIITGSDGLVGSESVKYFSKLGFKIIGIDNNSRKKFFGDDASVLKNREKLKSEVKAYNHINIDITSKKLNEVFEKYGNNIKLIIHTAAQPSHDWAATNPYLDFNVNAYGTLHLLENTRKYCKDAVFIFTSTNKVYGDRPNYLPLKEKRFRYEIDKKHIFYKKGINESMSIDQTTHSLFGVSKSAADLLVQEYGKYFNLKTVTFRGGCLTGESHSGAQLHGFLSYLVKSILSGKEYSIFGYKGKQVRDNIHSMDVVNAFDQFLNKPLRGGKVYNLGGGRENSCSILEAIEMIENLSGKKSNFKILSKNRIGDHVWWISYNSKFKKDFPNWNIKINLKSSLEKMIYHEKRLNE